MVYNTIETRHPTQKKTWVLGLSLGLGSELRPKPKTQRNQDSEYNSINYGI
jgi:hypothetical protein